MITEEMRKEAMTEIAFGWSDSARAIFEECAKIEPFDGGVGEFLDHCAACGGNWGGMFLSGIKSLYPKVWDAIPNDMGRSPFDKICSVLVLCGVDTSR